MKTKNTVLVVCLFFSVGTFASETNDFTFLKIGSKSKLVSVSKPAKKFRQPESSPPLKPEVVYTLPDGPWGHLEYYVIYLQSPTPRTPDEVPGETFWTFPHFSETKAKGLLHDIGIPGDILDRNSYSLISGAGVQIVPSDKLVRALTPEIRLRLRDLLKDHVENGWYRWPVVIESGNPREWYTRAGLAPKTTDLITSLCYTKNGTVLFSDIPCVLTQLESTEEKRQFLKALTRTRTLVLRLVIGESADVESIQSYWTTGRRRKDILPLLESVAETSGIEKLDVTHLLPPAIRSRLYTYPELSSPNIIEDCHRASLIAADALPKDLSGETDQTWDSIFEECLVPAKGDLQFGDVIAVYDAKTGDMIHSATYIAGDIVFTKNGLSPSSPWVFMRWQDMTAIYGYDAEISTKVLRKRVDQACR